jgi:hypothetical protein
LTAETLGSLSDRIATVEDARRAEAHNRIDRQALELESATNIAGMVRKWLGLFLFWAAIPAVGIGLFLALVFGKDFFDLRADAANATRYIQEVMNRVQATGDEAKRIADDALAKARKGDEDIKSTQAAVSKVQTDLTVRAAAVQKLGSNVDDTQRQIDTVTSRLNEQDAQVRRMSEQTHAIKTAQGIADIQTAYPLYGQHVAFTSTGEIIDAKSKPPGAIYLIFSLSLTSAIQPNINGQSAGEALAALRDHKYTAIVGSMTMLARTANSSQGVGMVMDANACTYWAKPPLRAPCIIYFRNALKSNAIEVQSLVSVAQTIQDNHIVYSDPTQLRADQQELLTLSGMDMVVVLGDYGQ